MNIGSPEIIAVAIILLVFFGGKKIPEFVRSLKGASQEFKKAATQDSPEENPSSKK